MATTAQITDIAPARQITLNRVSASSTRTFALTSGEVEIAPDTKVPSCSAETSIATTASGTNAYFWALRASISIFHKESNTFIKVEGAIGDLPDVSESLKGRVHDDSFWNTRDSGAQTSPCAQFKQYTAGLLRHALVAQTHGHSREEIKESAQRYLDAHLDTLQIVLQRYLQRQNTGDIELVRTDDGC